MTDKSAAAIREFAEKIVPVILNSGLLCNTEEIIEAFTGDLTALIEEHYVKKEDVNQEVEKRIADRFPGKEEILKYFNNHFNCYTDVTIRDYETTEIAMTNIAVLKMFEWLRSRLTCSEKPNNLKTEGGGE